MKAWTDESGISKMIVGSRETDKAKQTLDEKVKMIRETLKSMDTELQKWESLKCPDWADVGDLQRIDADLESIWEYMSECD